MPKFQINWTENVGYYTNIEADTKAEALRMFHAHEFVACEPCGFCEMETDSVEVMEVCPTCDANWSDKDGQYTIGCPECEDHEHRPD